MRESLWLKKSFFIYHNISCDISSVQYWQRLKWVPFGQCAEACGANNSLTRPCGHSVIGLLNHWEFNTRSPVSLRRGEWPRKNTVCHRSTLKQVDRQTSKQVDRQTSKQLDRLTSKPVDRQIRSIVGPSTSRIFELFPISLSIQMVLPNHLNYHTG